MVRFVVASGVPTGIDMAVGAAPAPSTTSSPAVAAVAAGGVRRVGTLRAAGAWCCALVGRHMSADTAIVRHHSRGQGVGRHRLVGRAGGGMGGGMRRVGVRHVECERGERGSGQKCMENARASACRVGSLWRWLRRAARCQSRCWCLLQCGRWGRRQRRWWGRRPWRGGQLCLLGGAAVTGAGLVAHSRGDRRAALAAALAGGFGFRRVGVLSAAAIAFLAWLGFLREQRRLLPRSGRGRAGWREPCSRQRGLVFASRS